MRPPRPGPLLNYISQQTRNKAFFQFFLNIVHSSLLYLAGEVMLQLVLLHIPSHLLDVVDEGWVSQKKMLTSPLSYISH